MDNQEYQELLYNYEKASVKICVEKCCDYKYIFFLNEYQNLNDIYNYVVSFYMHITKPIHLYIDKERKIEVPNTNKIFIKNYLHQNKILASSNMNVPVVYKFYMDMCSKENHINLHK
tara:strand:- start:963 stop:1313 length:351 start_codon:yes stop_codon:yes gene_type:complete